MGSKKELNIPLDVQRSFWRRAFTGNQRH